MLVSEAEALALVLGEEPPFPPFPPPLPLHWLSSVGEQLSVGMPPAPLEAEELGLGAIVCVAVLLGDGLADGLLNTVALGLTCGLVNV